jgi:predicted nucleic acid-binding protein
MRSGAIAGCGIVRAEVLRGIVADAARREMKLLFAHIPDVAMTPDVWDTIADLAWQLDRAGRVLPLTDIAIAACARRAGATLITHDGHFAQIPALRILRDLPPSIR